MQEEKRVFPMEMEVTKELYRVCDKIYAIHSAHMVWKEGEQWGDKIRR